MILTILKRFIIPKIYLEIRVSWTGAEEIIRPMNIVLKQSKKKPAYMCGLFVFLYLDLLLLFYRNICYQMNLYRRKERIKLSVHRNIFWRIQTWKTKEKLKF